MDSCLMMEMVFPVGAGENLERCARFGTIDMDHHVIGLIPEEKLAAFTFGKIVVGLHRNHHPS